MRFGRLLRAIAIFRKRLARQNDRLVARGRPVRLTLLRSRRGWRSCRGGALPSLPRCSFFALHGFLRDFPGLLDLWLPLGSRRRLLLALRPFKARFTIAAATSASAPTASLPATRSVSAIFRGVSAFEAIGGCCQGLGVHFFGFLRVAVAALKHSGRCCHSTGGR